MKESDGVQRNDVRWADVLIREGQTASVTRADVLTYSKTYMQSEALTVAVRK